MVYKNNVIGYQSLNSNTTGSQNTAIGYQSSKNIKKYRRIISINKMLKLWDLEL